MADDFGANTATTGTFHINGQVAGNIEIDSDHDWFKGYLFAGHTYVIQQRAFDGMFFLPEVRIHDQDGIELGIAKGGVSIVDAYLRFVPETPGFYFVDAAALASLTGSYEVVVAQQADALSAYNHWGSGNAATALLGDVNNADFDIIRVGTGFSSPGLGDGVREDIVSIAANGDVFVSLSNPNGSGFAVPVLATTGGTASDRLFRINDDGRDDLFQIYNGSAFVATGNGTDGLNDFAFWGSGFLPSATMREFGFNSEAYPDGFSFFHSSDAFQISNGNAQVALQNATHNGFLPFTTWATGLIGTEQLLNFNGDGLGDLLQLYNGRAYVATSNGINAFNAFVQVDSGVTASDRVGDFNADGRDDLFQIYNGNMYVSLSNGPSFNGFTQWGSGALSSARIGDFNGDGRADIFQVDANGVASVALANSVASFTPFHPWAASVGANDMLGLVNGDTLLDVVQVYNGSAYVWESIAVPPI